MVRKEKDIWEEGCVVGHLVCRNMLREKYGSKLGGKVLLEAKGVVWVGS